MSGAAAAAHAAPFAERLKRSAWVLPLAAMAALLALGINEMSFRSSSAALARADEHNHARLQIAAVSRALLDAETGQRGYLLSARPEYLDPYRRSVVSVPQSLAWLGEYYKDDVLADTLTKNFKAVAEAKLAELTTSLEMHAQGRHEAWRDLLLSNIGMEQMDRLRDLGEQLLALERRKFDAEMLQVASTLRWSRVGVALMVVLGVLALALFLRQGAMLAAVQRGERDRLEAEVALRTAELTQLAEHLQTAREDERGRLARELHDELGALLTAAKLDAARMKRSLADVYTPEFDKRLAHLVTMLNEGIGLKRRIIEDLRPSSLSNLGLKAALEILATEFGERAQLKVQMQIDSVDTDESTAIALYRLVQESLTNVAKYAAARQVEIRLARDADRIVVSVADDGKGFEASRVRGSAHGLVGMRYRVQARGGQFQVTSSPGHGTTVRASVPLQQARSAQPVG